MPPLHRHQLAYLTPAGWHEVLEHDWDGPARSCLRHWAEKALPLVVTRQPAARPAPGAPIALGLSAPSRWGRRLLALQAVPGHIAWFDEFPSLAQAMAVLPAADRSRLRGLEASLRQLSVGTHVFGSAGWQCLTRLTYLHDRSDLDLWLGVQGPEQADLVAQLLQQCDTGLRIDGELVFTDGSAVAWREWAAWRAGLCRQMLVKRLDGASLASTSPPGASAWPHAA